MMLEKLNYFLKKNPSALQIIIFVAVVLVLFMVIVVSSLQIVQQRYLLTEMEESVFELKNENKLLVEKIEKTSTSKYIEEKARDELGMVRNSEIPVQVTEELVSIEKEETNVIDSKDKVGLYLKAWYEELGNWFESAKKKG